MDEIYTVLVSMDYPDALTANLRRTTDVTRGIIEKTRGDLTYAQQQRSLERSLRDFETRVMRRAASRRDAVNAADQLVLTKSEVLGHREWRHRLANVQRWAGRSQSDDRRTHGLPKAQGRGLSPWTPLCGPAGWRSTSARTG